MSESYISCLYHKILQRPGAVRKKLPLMKQSGVGGEQKKELKSTGARERVF